MSTNKVNEIVAGCSLDGLKNRISTCGTNAPLKNEFYLSDVVVPGTRGGEPLTGTRAERSRISSGLIWPPEANVKISSSNFIKRIPVSWAWRLLIDGGDRHVRWKVDRSESVDISRVIAAHVFDCLNKINTSPAKIILSIPNDLDEAGQDKLIRALRKYGFNSKVNNLSFVWRPVAAALAWLDKVQDDLNVNLGGNEFILNVHIGPDAIEFAGFSLKEKEYKGQKYIVPLRDSNQTKFSLCGSDWAANLIHEFFSDDDLSAAWQAFTNFPEVWEILAQQQFDSKKLPKVFCQNGSWVLWQLDKIWGSKIFDLPAVTSTFMEKITSKHSQHARNNSTGGTWKENFSRGIVQALNHFNNKKLLGVILSGPLASTSPEFWLNDIRDTLTSYGLNFEISRQAALGKIWAPAFDQDIISEGASIYGSRLIRGEPTYLDKLPQLYILANKRGAQCWEPLIKGDLEVEGGKEHRNTLKRLFSLNRNKMNLDVWLRKEKGESYKKARFLFPYAPTDEMPLDTEVCAASASGLAKVELIPEDNEFLGGHRGVSLDYTTMEDTNILPSKEIGFPQVEDLEIDENDFRLLAPNFSNMWDQFLTTDLLHEKYLEYVGNIRREIDKARRFPSDFKKYGRIVNKDGKTRTEKAQKVLNKVSEKLGQDFKRSLAGELDRRYRTKNLIIQHIYSASTWLFSAAPEEVRLYIKKRLSFSARSGNADHILNTSRLVYGAGRCFDDQEEFHLFYRNVIERINEVRVSGHGTAFPIYDLRAISRLLSLREYAPDAMSREQAMQFLQIIIQRMEEKVREKKFSQVFIQSIKTFVFLLRFRVEDSVFLSSEVKTDKVFFDRIIDCLDSGIRFLKMQRIERRMESVKKLLEEIKKYMYFKGSENIINIFEELEDPEDPEGES